MVLVSSSMGLQFIWFSWKFFECEGFSLQYGYCNYFLEAIFVKYQQSDIFSISCRPMQCMLTDKWCPGRVCGFYLVWVLILALFREYTSLIVRYYLYLNIEQIYSYLCLYISLFQSVMVFIHQKNVQFSICVVNLVFYEFTVFSMAFQS